MWNLCQTYLFDCNEIDVEGKNAVVIIYEELCRDNQYLKALMHGKDIYTDFDELEFLAKVGSDLNLRCIDPENSGRTMLLDAAKRGRKHLFGILLKLGADPDIRCLRGRSLGDYIREDYSE